MASSSDNIPASNSPRPGSGPETKIAPQLESVLRNLNVNLEDELTRYRRQRHGRVPPPPPPRRMAQRQSIDLISVAASAAGDDAAAAQPLQSTPPPPPPNPFLKQDPELAEEPTLPDMELFSDLGDGELGLDLGEPSAQTGLDPDKSLDQPEPAKADLDESALPVHANDSPTVGYLESSEELLKSIEEEQTEQSSAPEPYSPERRNNSLLKLAGLVLVLLGGVGVGFAITYPAQLQSLRSRLFPAGEPAPADTDAAGTAAEGGGTAPGDSTPAAAGTTEPETTKVSPENYKPPGPDLSTREFKKLDDVKDLVTLELDEANGTGTAPATLPNPAQSPLPNPVQPAAPAAPAAAPATGQLPSPTSSSNVGAASPAPRPAAPSAAPSPTAPATAPPPLTAAAGSNFYVITSYTGDASLNKAREFVPDAFVRNFKAGARVQLAAFDNREQAAEQVEFLTQRGITVELFGPTNE